MHFPVDPVSVDAKSEPCNPDMGRKRKMAG